MVILLSSSANALCFEKVSGAETGHVHPRLLELPNDQLLFGAQKGLFRFDPANGGRLHRVSGDETGQVYDLQQLKDEVILVRGDRGWFRFNGAYDGKVTAISSPTTGWTSGSHDLRDGTRLIWAAEGLFLLDPADGGKITALGSRDLGYILNEQPDGSLLLMRWDASQPLLLHVLTPGVGVERIGGEQVEYFKRYRELPTGAVLFLGWKQPVEGGASIFRFDPAQKRVSLLPGGDIGFVTEWPDLTDGRVLLTDAKFLYILDPTNVDRPLKVRGPKLGELLNWFELKDGMWLLQTTRGWFRFELVGDGKIVKVSGADTGEISASFSLPNGGLLLHEKERLFHYSPENGIRPVTGVQTGRVYELIEAPGGALLILAERGIFAFDPKVPVNVTALLEQGPGVLYRWREAPGQSLLFWTERGLHRFDSRTRRLSRIPGPETGNLMSSHILADGRVLLQAFRGWFRLDLTGDGRLTSLRGPGTSHVSNWLELKGGGLLLETAYRLLRYDPAGEGKVEHVPGAGELWITNERIGSSIFLRDSQNLYVFDEESREGVKVLPGGKTGQVWQVQKMKDGALIFLTEEGLFRATLCH